MSPLLVLGSSNIDFTMAVPSLPLRGETVTDGVFMQTFGGKGANQAVAAVRAGVPTRFISCLGNDPYAPILMNNLLGVGLNLDGMVHVTDQPSGTALVMSEAGGMNYLTVAPGSNYALSPEFIREREDLIRSASCLLLQMEIPVESNLEAIQIAKQAGVRVFLNYAPARVHELKLLTNLDLLIVNENEASTLTSIDPVDAESTRLAGEALLRLGPSAVLLTLGRRGCLWMDNNQFVECPAFPVEAVDTTAAGDTFCGAFCAATLGGRPLDMALRFASAAAALSVTKMGAQSSIPGLSEIDAFLSSRQKS